MKTEPYAHGYFWAENELLDTSGWNLSWDWTAGSAVTFISDMLCWTQALLGGEVVSTTTLKQMTTPVPPAVEYGFWLEISDRFKAFFGEKVIGHNGANPGFYAEWLYFPEPNRAIFVALNRLDITEAPVAVDAGAVIMSILAGVRDIL